jgi:hypothetical protein
MVVRQGARMTREHALDWLRRRLPRRAGQPHDAESLLDGLCLSQLALDADGFLIARENEKPPPATDLEAPGEGEFDWGPKPWSPAAAPSSIPTAPETP